MLGVTALRRTAVAPSVLRRAVSSSLGGVSAQRANNHTLAALTNNNSKRPNVPVSYVAAVESPSGFSDVAAPSVITRTLSTTTTPSPSAGGNTVEVSQPGMLTLVQDYPGRTGYWRVGVPPSGPMDHFSFRLANRLVGNDVGAAALEITFAGPTLKFNNDTLIALTGAKVTAELDGKEVPSYKSIKVSKGSTLTINAIDSAGTRAYLAIGGGIEASDYLGSKATFPLGALGGPFEGRGLKAGVIV